MNCLIVYSHPNPKSFNNAILQTANEEFKKNGFEVKIRDLYDLNFQPVLKAADFEYLQKGECADDIKIEQDNIRWADLIVFIYPVWWTGLPAMLKGYVDRVFSYGFAYKYGDKGVIPLLTDKKALLLSTQGTPEGFYENSGMHNSMKMTSDTGIFNFCGIEVKEHLFFSGVPSVSNEKRQEYLEKIKQLIKNI